MVRSPHPHARVGLIDIAAAAAMAGVLAVLTGADAKQDGLKPIPHDPNWTGPPDAVLRMPEGFEVFLTENRPMPHDIVRFVGEPVAMVIAESAALAAEAADLVDVTYEPLPAMVHADDALAPDAPQVWPGCPGNLALTCEVGDQTATGQAFARADHVVKFEGWIHRVNGSPMEPRSVIGEYDSAADHYTLRTGSGRGVVQTRERLSKVLDVPLENCRAIFGDMGGNFGTRNGFFPEYALVPWASKRVGRPVKWTASRQECFLTDYQARDLRSSAELALDRDGNFLAMRGTNTMNLGANTVYFWPLRKGLSMMQSVYHIPAAHFRGRAVLTNTMSTAVYRSAGRPEAVYMIERLIELAADQCGFDRVELRRRNLIASDAMPYTNAVGATYDSGDYLAAMNRALEVSDWNGFAARKKASAERGLCRGIGIANYIEITSGIPRERAELIVCEDGYVDFVVGTMSSGQGHETSFPQLAAEWLQVPFEKVRFVANDTDRVSVGGGSHSGRSMRLISIAVTDAIEELLARGKTIAAQMLQSDVETITYQNGMFSAPDGGSVDLWQVSKAADNLEGGSPGPLMGVGDITNRTGGFPYGAHVCEVEVDPETGMTRIVAWTGIDDVGLAVNPLILHGQAHGASAQGIGQALLEAVEYDPETAQLLTGSFLDYAMPRADTLPSFKTEIMEVPASSHPHGIRPGGEGGTTPALGLLINAIVDALSDYGVKDIQMPATPARVWQAIKDASEE